MRGLLKRSAIRIWLVAFAAFFVIGAAWALAQPYEGPPDELNHTLKAAAVADGQFFPVPTSRGHGQSGAWVTVPKALSLHKIMCLDRRRSASAACQPKIGDPTWGHTVHIVSTAGRYNSIYYALVGGPVRLRPDMAGIIAGRLISAGLCAMFLASAMAACAGVRRRAPMVAGLVLAATPVVFHLAGSINPNGLEIAAAISFWAAVIPLLLGGSTERIPVLARRAGLAAIFLAQLRALGPVWMGAIPAVLLIPPDWERLREVLAHRAVWFWSIVAGLSTLAGLAWTFVFKSDVIGHYPPRHHITFFESVRLLLAHRTIPMLSQGIASFGHLEAPRPPGVRPVWELALAVLVIAAMAFGSWTARWRMFALAAGTVVFAVISDALIVNSFGFSSYGRYFMPLLVGLPLLAGFTLAQRESPGLQWQRNLSRLCLMLLPAQLLSLVWQMDRWQSGLGPGRSLNPLQGRWLPLAGPVLPLLLMLAGLAIIGVLAWRQTNQPRQAVPVAARPAADQERALAGP